MENLWSTESMKKLAILNTSTYIYPTYNKNTDQSFCFSTAYYLHIYSRVLETFMNVTCAFQKLIDTKCTYYDNAHGALHVKWIKNIPKSLWDTQCSGNMEHLKCVMIVSRDLKIFDS